MKRVDHIPAIDAATRLLKPPPVALGQGCTVNILFMYDKVNLDIFWLNDAALEGSANFPAPQ